MRRRSKRLKAGYPLGVESRDCLDGEASDAPTLRRVGVGRGRRRRQSPGLQRDGADACAYENRARSNGDNLMFETGSFASRCSVRLIHEVVNKFDSCKKDLVRSIGFEGILCFPPMKQINRRFSMWLMRSVDEHSSSLNIAEHIQIRFSKLDVGHVFGIPTEGKNVLDITASKRDARDRVIQRYLGEEFRDQRSIKIVQQILERDYGREISKEDGDRFRVAFVVFVVSNLLCPSAKHDYASVDYWNAIEHPDCISSYDWAGFVITHLLEAVVKLKEDIKNNLKFPIVSGCSIFLQVLYLDSLDLEYLSLEHNTFPRVRVFPYDTIRAFMLADNNFARYCKGDGSIPIVKLRDADRCIYSWASDASEACDDPRTGYLLAIWESAVAMVNLLDIPLEAAGLLFVAVVDFQDQINHGLVVSGTQAVKFLTVLVSIMTPFRRGYSYESSYAFGVVNNVDRLIEDAIRRGTSLIAFPIPDSGSNLSCCDNELSGTEVVRCNGNGASVLARSTRGVSFGAAHMLGRTRAGDKVHQSMNCAFSSLDELPHCLNVDVRVATIMAKFYSVFRTLKPRNEFDLNGSSTGDTSATSSSSSRPRCYNAVSSPWDLGYEWSYAGSNSQSFFEKLSTMQDDQRLAILHREPRYIQVTCSAMYRQFSGRCEMELDMFDALVRVLKQEDDILYDCFGSMRWRHFFESDLMSLILGGSVDIADSKLRDHLCLSETVYDLSQCKLVFFPALLQCQWTCFVWEQHKNAISVFDPSFDAVSGGGRCRLIERACYMLKLALKTLIGPVFTGVTRDPTCADVCIMNLLDKSVPRLNCSGLLCAMFFRCYDGFDLNPNTAQVDREALAAKLMYEVSKLRGNSGSILVFGDGLNDS